MTAADPRQLLDQLDALRAAATPGPWEHVTDDHGRKGVEHSVWSDSGECYVAEVLPGPDAALIVAAVNSLPQLVAALRGVMKVADELSAWRDNARRYEQHAASEGSRDLADQAHVRALAD